METLITDSPDQAAEFIRRGGVVAFPTETVYGLGANLFNETAIGNIYAAKGRPADNPLIVHVGSPAQVETVAAAVSHPARLLIDAFFPGPLTVVLPKRHEVPYIATAGLETVGVRMPDHDLALRFLRACGTPVAAPSANVSGRPSPTSWETVCADLGGRIPCILKGERTQIGLESTVVDCTSDVPTILRTGGVSLEELQSVVPATCLHSAELTTGPAPSPGMKHRHYAPNGGVVLVQSPDEGAPPQNAAYIGLSAPCDPDAFARILVAADVATYGREVFEYFRECDRLGIEVIWCQRVEPTGLGLALMDRLDRAARR